MDRNDVERMLAQVDEKYIAELTGDELTETGKKPIRRRWYSAVAAAAMVACCVGIGYSLLSDIQRSPLPQSSVEQSRPAEPESGLVAGLTDREVGNILADAREQSFSLGDGFLFPDTCLAYTSPTVPELSYLPFADVAVYYSAGEFNTGDTIDRVRIKAQDGERSLTLTVYAAADPYRESYLKLTDGMYLCAPSHQSQTDTLYAFGDAVSCEIRTTGLTQREILQIAVDVLQDEKIAQMPEKRALVGDMRTISLEQAVYLTFCYGHVIQAESIDGMPMCFCRLENDVTLVQTWEKADRTFVACCSLEDPELPELSDWAEVLQEPYSTPSGDGYSVHFQLPRDDGCYVGFSGELTEDGIWELSDHCAGAYPELTLQEANEIPCFQGCVPQWGEPQTLWRETIPDPESESGVRDELRVNYEGTDWGIGVTFTTASAQAVGTEHLLSPEEWDAAMVGNAPYTDWDEENSLFTTEFLLDAGQFRVYVSACGTDLKQLDSYARALFDLLQDSAPDEIYN